MSLNQGYSYHEALNQKARGHTLLSYLVTFYPHSSKMTWQERIQRGEVLLNAQPAQENIALQTGQRLTWHRPPWQEEAVPLNFELIYEDADLIIVNKASGLPTLPAGGFLENTLLYLLRSHFPTANPVHRLGRATSGLVLFSKTKEAAKQLSQTWQQDVQKIYRALASGLAPEDSYEIKAPIGPVKHPKLDSLYAANSLGKAAHSSARVLERRNNETVFSVELDTGRPHQIRIHLAYIGHPLVGDPLYTMGGLPFSQNPALPGEGGYLLHAEKLIFQHPMLKKKLELSAPIPELLRLQNS